MKTLRLASFGVRGFVGVSLDPTVIIDYASSFATFVDGGTVLVGRDTRYSSPMLHAAVTAGLQSAGCQVLDFGVCPTPMLQYCVKPYKAKGAISISGGHNGMGWNSINLIDAEGGFVEPLGGEFVLDCFHAGHFLKADWKSLKSVKEVEGFEQKYFSALEAFVNAKAIREANYTVLIDPVGGAGCKYLNSFAEAFNLNLVPINAEPSGYLAREAEPRPRAGLQMASIINHLKGDVGFILSSDVGRVSYVTNTGEPLSEEGTFALLTEHVLRKNKGPVVTNTCTTQAIDDLAARHDVPLIKSPVGQAHVMSTLVDEYGVIGGEGNGSVALPGFSRAFDGFLIMALTLECMAESGKTLNELVSALPVYHIIKRSVQCESRDAFRILRGVKERLIFDIIEMDLTDGLRMTWEDGWMHIRASKTEQILRIISESADKDVAVQRAEEVIRIVNGLL